MEKRKTTNRKDIRKVTPSNANSFYDVFKKRAYKDNHQYKLVAGITQVRFSRTKKD